MQALKLACKELGLEFVEGQKTIRWFGKWMRDYDAADAAYKLGIKPEEYGKCDHAIRVSGSGYDIGVLKRPSGGYQIYWDFYGTGHAITKAVGGTSAPKLMQSYAAHKTMLEAKRKGWSATRVNLPNGKIQIKIGGMR